MKFIKKNSKKTQNPPCQSSVDKHSYSNCYSLTIRTGNGIDLGLNSISELVCLLNKICEHCVLNVEKDGLAAHIQGGLFFKEPCRTDKLKEKIKKIADDIYFAMNKQIGRLDTTLQKSYFDKRGVVLKAHNDFHVLVKYCMKELSECWVLQWDPSTLLLYKYDRKMWDVIKEVYDDSMPKNVDKVFHFPPSPPLGGE